jgi:hypothetical protein
MRSRKQVKLRRDLKKRLTLRSLTAKNQKMLNLRLMLWLKLRLKRLSMANLKNN